jgi:hypothetical protein
VWKGENVRSEMRGEVRREEERIEEKRREEKRGEERLNWNQRVGSRRNTAYERNE